MSEKLEQEKSSQIISYDENEIPDHAIDEQHAEPTEEDWKNLRQVADRIPISAYLVLVIEFCERFTYYGLTGPFQNYIQNPAPPSCNVYI
ncbi:uncharacterized protein BX663DRAFT_507333 [Cokeromyces recurvatus]|uniref:uncharacterized protein n=1 Tax=Cokeromyces recurvatus TaxID=90255 RepID=UPI0022200978|nr:uncharacterized protein BX663DRAFT_507333 [Cokeromyces recurvatus]KAI7903702.1 hypothetical protein BX663DRAFT_507333 [Cokeromyces recurvatus]